MTHEFNPNQHNSLSPALEQIPEVSGVWAEYISEDKEYLKQVATIRRWSFHDDDDYSDYLIGIPNEHEWYPPCDNVRILLFHSDEVGVEEGYETVPTVAIRVQGDRVTHMWPGECDDNSRIEEVNVDLSLASTVARKLSEMDRASNFIRIIDQAAQIDAIDKKAKSGQDLSVEDIEFLYDINGKIDRAFTRDPRIEELKQNRPQHKLMLLEKYGDDAEWMILDERELSHSKVKELLETTNLKDIVVNKLDPNEVLEYFSDIKEYGINIDINTILLGADYNGLRDDDSFLVEMLNAGADPDLLVDVLLESSMSFCPNPITLLKAGADPDNMISKMEPGFYLVWNLVALRDYGITVDTGPIMKYLIPHEIGRHLGILLDYGADTDLETLKTQIPADFVALHLDRYLNAGVNIDLDELLSKLNDAKKLAFINQLNNSGANIDVDELVAKFSLNVIIRNLLSLTEAGANVDFKHIIKTAYKHTDRHEKVLSLIPEDDVTATDIKKIIDECGLPVISSASEYIDFFYQYNEPTEPLER